MLQVVFVKVDVYVGYYDKKYRYTYVGGGGLALYYSTLPKFNITPEKWRLEDYFPIGKVTFQGLC